MEKAKKTELTREKIFSAALVEFGTKGYREATLNNMCAVNHISKGLIYHNFKNKDDIYLLCVEYAIDAFIAYMQKNYDDEQGLKGYLYLRNEFFSQNTLLGRIFFEAVLQPPKHLDWDIKALKAELNEFTESVYERAINKVKLREGISKEQAVGYCRMINEIFNGYYNTADFEEITFASIISDYEEGLGKMLDLMFYGIAKENTLIGVFE